MWWIIGIVWLTHDGPIFYGHRQLEAESKEEATEKAKDAVLVGNGYPPPKGQMHPCLIYGPMPIPVPNWTTEYD